MKKIRKLIQEIKEEWVFVGLEVLSTTFLLGILAFFSICYVIVCGMEGDVVGAVLFAKIATALAGASLVLVISLVFVLLLVAKDLVAKGKMGKAEE